MDVLCTIKIKNKSQNLYHERIKDQSPYQNQGQYAQLQSGASSILQCPKSGLKGHISSLHLQNLGREPKFGTYVYQRQVNMSKSRSRCLTPVRNLQHPPEPQMRTKRTWMFRHLQNQDREPKFGSWVYQRPVIILKSRSRYLTPVRNLQHPPKPKIRT